MDEALAPTPSLSPETVAELNQLLAKESWTKNRQFFVNPDSITISLFDNLLIDETLTDVPLHFKDIPIIPHHFSHLPHHFSLYARDFASVALETSSETENHVDGLSPTQLHKLTRFVNGIVAIDFYLDRQVVVSLPAVSYVEEVQRLGFDTFSAWNCVFHLNCSPTWERKPSRPTEDDLAIFTQGDVIAPGSTIFSSTGEPSVIGVFLVPRSRTQDIKEIQYFTVCAHSFVRMKSFCLELNGRCALRVIIILFVAYCIWDSGASELLPIYQHFCLSRGVVMAQECMFGPPLVRNPVNEGAKPSMPTMPMLLLDLFLMAPGILRLMIVTSIHDFGLERLFLLSIRWDLLMEFSLVFWFLLWAWKTPFLRETFVRSFMMQEELICIPHTLGRLCPLLVSLRIPFSIPFFAAWCGRFVLYFSNRSLLIAPLVQYIGLFFICWDILQLVWYLEFPSSFTVLQQIVSSSHEKIGKVVASYRYFALLSFARPFARRNASEWCINDVAVAKLDNPLPVTERDLMHWNEGGLTRHHPLYTIGLGSSTTNRVPIEGHLGGYRYLITSPKPTDFSNVMFIWRGPRSSRSQPGALVFRYNTSGEDIGNKQLVAVGFQSNRLDPEMMDRLDPGGYWDFVVRPPDGMKQHFVALTPVQ